MPDITVIDLTHVTIDGVAAGSVTDVLANHDPGVVLTPGVEDSGFRSALILALVARDELIQKNHESKLNSLIESHAQAFAKQADAHVEILTQRNEAMDAERELSEAKLADLMASIEARHAEVLAATVAGHEQVLVDFKERVQVRHTDLLAEHAKEIAKRDSSLVTMQAIAKDQQEMICALGDTALGREMVRKRRCKELHAQKAKIEAELATVDTV